MVKVSVIVPVYNVEIYLRECLDSIINQSLTDIEIICVNDGSIDNSLGILEEYEEKDSRISIISQENQGLGAARNTGLRHAKGDYIYFIDSDDFIKLNALEVVYNLCEEKSLDFLMFQLINYDDETGEYYQDSHYDMGELASFVGENVFSYEELDDLIFEIPVSAVNKLYNKSFLDNLNVKFPEGLLFEDNAFFWEVFFSAKRVFLVQEHFYCRRRHESSITGNASIRYLDTIKVYDLIFDVFKKHGLFDKFKSTLFNQRVYFTNFRFNQVNKKDKKLFFEEMHKDSIRISEEYGSDEVLDCLSDKNKFIFNSIIKSKSSDEFILLIRNHNLEKSIIKLKTNNKKLKKQIRKTKKKNKLMLSSNSWKITKPIRFFTNLFR